jgi:hypothetical protein
MFSPIPPLARRSPANGITIKEIRDLRQCKTEMMPARWLRVSLAIIDRLIILRRRLQELAGIFLACE